MGFLTEGFNNEELILLPLGAAAAKRYIYHGAVLVAGLLSHPADAGEASVFDKA